MSDKCERLKDKNLLNDLKFLTDILRHLNILKKRLLGEGNLFPVLVVCINSVID